MAVLSALKVTRCVLTSHARDLALVRPLEDVTVVAFVPAAFGLKIENGHGFYRIIELGGSPTTILRDRKSPLDASARRDTQQVEAAFADLFQD